MSRILRRPMFRGGPVDSRGSGITSGLDKPKRGLVDEPGGYAGISMSGLKNYADIFGGSGSGSTSGGQITNKARSSINNRNPFKMSGYTPRQFAPSSFRDELRALSIPGLKTIGLTGSPFAAVGGLAYLNRPKNLEALQIMKDEPSSTFDETGAFEFDDYTKRLIEAEKGDSEKISFTDALFMDPETKTYPKIFGRTEDRDKQQEIEKKIDKAEDARIDVLKALTADEAYEVAEKKPGKEIEIKSKVKDKDTEESTELTVKDYIKMLGGDKARRRDTSDLLAQASAAFLGTGSVREGLSEFMNKVAASGPGRLEKIEQAAATLDIKDKISSKRAAEQLKNLLGTKDYEAMLRLRMSDPSLQSFETNLVDTAKSLGKSYKNLGVIGNTINKKYGSGSFGGEVSDDTDYVEGKYYIQDTGDGEKIVFKIVEGKAQEVHRII